MALKTNLLTRFKQIFYTFGSIVIIVFTYTPTYDFFVKLFGEDAKMNGALTTAAVTIIYTLFLAWIVDPIVSMYGDGIIVEDEIKWTTSEGTSITTLDYLVEENWESSIRSVNITVTCTPKKVWLFSLLRFMGFGILIYGSGDNLAFTKANGKESRRYRVLNNKAVFVNSFYNASVKDNGNIWDIVFDIKLLDPSARESSIYAKFAFGTKKHKIKCKGFLMKLLNEPLIISMVRNG